MSDGEDSEYDVPDLPPMLPDLDDLPPARSFDTLPHSASQGPNGGPVGDGAQGDDGPGSKPVAPADKPKKIRKPVPKLDAVRLCDSKRGMPYLVQDFKSIRFQGKGHEASDIRMLMRRYEHWAHRLFPKYPLRTVTEIIETSLGTKKDVRVCLAQLRRGDDDSGEMDVDILEPEPVLPLQSLTM